MRVIFAIIALITCAGTFCGLKTNFTYQPRTSEVRMYIAPTESKTDTENTVQREDL